MIKHKSTEVLGWIPDTVCRLRHLFKKQRLGPAVVPRVQHWPYTKRTRGSIPASHLAPRAPPGEPQHCRVWPCTFSPYFPNKLVYKNQKLRLEIPSTPVLGISPTLPVLGVYPQIRNSTRTASSTYARTTSQAPKTPSVPEDGCVDKGNVAFPHNGIY